MNNFTLAFDDTAEGKLLPKECIKKMLEGTLNGRLFIPGWPYDNNYSDEKKVYEIVTDWDKADAESVAMAFDELDAGLKEIADVYDKLGSGEDENKALLSKEALEVWKTYVKPHSVNDSKYDAVDDIEGRIESMEMAKSFSDVLIDIASENGEELSWDPGEDEVTVTETEKALCKEYYDRVHEELGARIGGGIASYDVVIRAARLCRLYSLNAPKVITDNEACLLIQAMMVNRFAKELIIH